MRSRTGLRLALIAALAASLLGASCAREEAAQPAIPESGTVTGLVTSVTPEQGALESFEVEDEASGETFTVEISDDVDYGFDLEHVREHMAGEDPVKVALEERDGALVATSIEDV